MFFKVKKCLPLGFIVIILYTCCLVFACCTKPCMLWLSNSVFPRCAGSQIYFDNSTAHTSALAIWLFLCDWHCVRSVISIILCHVLMCLTNEKFVWTAKLPFVDNFSFILGQSWQFQNFVQKCWLLYRLLYLDFHFKVVLDVSITMAWNFKCLGHDQSTVCMQVLEVIPWV